MAMKAGDLITKCGKLKSGWSTRDQKIRDWYNVLLLKDSLKQEGMETVTANDPKTGYNLGKHLLTSSTTAHKIDIEELKPNEIQATSYLESFATKRWVAEENRYRRMGRQSLKGELLGFMLATGWYSVFSMVSQDKIWTEVWNPIEVYPEYGSEGLIELAHIYGLTPAAANRKVKLMGWPVKSPFTHNVNLYDYWGYDNDGDLVNGIILGTEFVKDLQKDAALNNLMQKLGEPVMPVFMSPVGGLPDRGSIVKSKDWQKNYGESMVATNEELGKNYNKMLSFAQQATRSAAQHRWIERTAGDYQIAKEEDMDKWGAIFRMGPNDSLEPLVPPAIPIELRTIMFEYSNMLQRGMFPAAVFGNVQQQMSYLAMANVASAAMQVLTPFNDNYKGLMSDLNNYHFNMVKFNDFNPYDFKMPEGLPDQIEFHVQSDIEIPGYLIQRATVSRMLDPTFRLPTRVVMDKFWPEIRDPLRAMGESRKDDAMMNPKAIMVDSIIAYKEHSKALREAGDNESAGLYDKLAASLEAELVGQQPPQQRTGREVSPGEQAIMREAFPTKEAQAPQEGMGRI